MSRQRWYRSNESGPAGSVGVSVSAGSAPFGVLVFEVAMLQVQVLEPLEIALQRRELRLVHLRLDRPRELHAASAPHLADDRRDLPRLARLERRERATQRHHGAA